MNTRTTYYIYADAGKVRMRSYFFYRQRGQSAHGERHEGRMDIGLDTGYVRPGGSVGNNVESF